MVCPNVTVMTKERIAQSKRARAGALTLVDCSHKWRELVSSGRLVCKCHDVTFVLFCFDFVIMISLKPRPSFNRPSICRRPDSHTCFFLSFFHFFIWRRRFFRVFFVPFPLSLCMESTSYVLSFQMVFFYLVTTGWILDISYGVIQSIEL